MNVNKCPKAAGVWWVSFDDGEKVVENALVDVRYFRGEASFAQGAIVRFIDGSDRWFAMDTIDQEIVQPCEGSGGLSGHNNPWSSSAGDQRRITWLSEVSKPRGMPRKGAPVCNTN